MSVDTDQVVFWILAGLMTAGSVLLLVRPLVAGKADDADKGLATLIIWGVPLLTLGLYAALGHPDLTAWRTQPGLPPFIAASVTKLTADVKQNPTDLQGWLLLGDVYAKIRRYDEAAAAYRRAAELDPATPSYAALVGQMLVRRNGDAVGADAVVWFAKARDEPLSRYYVALAMAQAGNWDDALARWQALKQVLPNDAQWQATLDARIADARRALGLERH